MVEKQISHLALPIHWFVGSLTDMHAWPVPRFVYIPYQSGRLIIPSKSSGNFDHGRQTLIEPDT